MKKEITVEIGYKDFIFDNIFDAVKFADIAARTGEKPEDVQVVVQYKKEEEDEV